jgi:GNAT superfamily N-acetyltransferase
MAPRPGLGQDGRMTTIRGLTSDDWDDWHALWGGYLAFYRAELADDVTQAGFERLCGSADDMFGLLALDDGGVGIGMANCVVHPATWSRQTSCYLEDLFVAPTARGGDVGRALIHAVRDEARRRECDRVYWHTQQYNGRARSLYDTVGRPTSFVVYEMRV